VIKNTYDRTVKKPFDFQLSKIDGLVKSHPTVMPDLIRHPERIGNTGFRLSPE